MGKTYVVVGAGFRGFCDSMALLEIPGVTVHLLEPAPFFGGVMNSMEVCGFNVDKGVHVFDSIPKALADVVNEIMDGQTRPIDFISASAFNGCVTEGYSLPDLSSLSPAIKSQIAIEVIELASSSHRVRTEPGNLLELFESRYGKTAGRIFCDIFQKVYGLAAASVEASAIAQTSMGRLKFLDDAEMLVLKANPWLDTVLAARRKAVGKVDDFVSIYPDTGEAMRGWCDRAKKWLEAKGAKIFLGEKILNMRDEGSHVRVTTDKQSIDADLVIWSNDNVAALAKTVGVEESASPLIYGTPMLFVTLVTQADRIKNFTYLQNFDPDGFTYRTAALGIFSGQIKRDGTSFITCECPAEIGSARWEDAPGAPVAAWQECRKLGLVADNAELTDANAIRIPASFKIARLGYHQKVSAFREDLSAVSKRIVLRDVVPFFRRDIYLDSLNLRALINE